MRALKYSSRIVLVVLFFLLSAGNEVASAQCGPDAWRPVVTIQKVRGKERRVSRKASKPFEAFAHYKFNRRGLDPETGPVPPRKFDEYGRIRGCDQAARLDNFAIQLQNSPGWTGYIVASGPAGDFQKQGYASYAVDYLVNTRGIERSQLITVNGGESRELVIQLWLFPPEETQLN